MSQRCRKSCQVVKALCELEWFMRLCCFCSMRKLDVIYRILPCRRAVLPLSGFDAEARCWIYLSINALDAWPQTAKRSQPKVLHRDLKTAHCFNTVFSKLFLAWILQQRGLIISIWTNPTYLINDYFSMRQPKEQLKCKTNSFTSRELKQILRVTQI